MARRPDRLMIPGADWFPPPGPPKRRHALPQEALTSCDCLLPVFGKADGRLSDSNCTERREQLVNEDQAKGKLKQGQGELQERWGDAKEKADDLWDELKDEIDGDEDEDAERDSRPGTSR